MNLQHSRSSNRKHKIKQPPLDHRLAKVGGTMAWGQLLPPAKAIYRYPLVNVYIAMERSTIFNGKIHYFYGHFPLLR